MLCCTAGSWQVRSSCRGIGSFLAGGTAPQPMGHSLFVSPGIHLTPWSPDQKKNYFVGGKVVCLWPGEGAELAHQVICSVLTLSKGEFRPPEEKNRKAEREEGQSTSAQQVLATVQLPWKEAIGWVASPDWDKHTSSYWLSLQDMLFELGMKFCSSQFAWHECCSADYDHGESLHWRYFYNRSFLASLLWDQHHLDHTENWKWFRASAAAKRQVSKRSCMSSASSWGCHDWNLPHLGN